MAAPLQGDINTAADEFDATFLADGTTVVFTRAPFSGQRPEAQAGGTDLYVVRYRLSRER